MDSVLQKSEFFPFSFNRSLERKRGLIFYPHFTGEDTELGVTCPEIHNQQSTKGHGEFGYWAPLPLPCHTHTPSWMPSPSAALENEQVCVIQLSQFCSRARGSCRVGRIQCFRGIHFVTFPESLWVTFGVFQAVGSRSVTKKTSLTCWKLWNHETGPAGSEGRTPGSAIQKGKGNSSNQ